MSYTRHHVFQHFGPQLDEATVLLLLELINELRQNQGIPPYTFQEFLDKIMNHLTNCPAYDWMNSPGP